MNLDRTPKLGQSDL